MKIKLKINSFLFFLLFCFSLNAQIIVPLNSNATTSDCTSFDFDCGPCVQKWFASPDMSIIEGSIFGVETNCSVIPENFEVSPGASLNLEIRFTDRDKWKLKGNCDPDNNFWNYVTTPNHTVTFKIIGGTNASFTPFPDPLPNPISIVDEISTGVTIISEGENENVQATVLGSQTVPIYFFPNAVFNNTVSVSVTITDNATPPLPFEAPAVEST